MSILVVGFWRKSSYSGPDGNCVELAPASEGGVAFRNSRDPEGATIFYTQDEFRAFLKGAKAGEFDNLIA